MSPGWKKRTAAQASCGPFPIQVVAVDYHAPLVAALDLPETETVYAPLSALGGRWLAPGFISSSGWDQPSPTALH